MVAIGLWIVFGLCVFGKRKAVTGIESKQEGMQCG